MFGYDFPPYLFEWTQRNYLRTLEDNLTGPGKTTKAQRAQKKLAQSKRITRERAKAKRVRSQKRNQRRR